MRIDEVEEVGQISPEKVANVKKNNFLFSNLPLPQAKYSDVLSVKGGTGKYLFRQELRKYDEDNDWLTITFVWDPKISTIPSLNKAMKDAIESAEDYVNQTNQKKFNIALFKLKANKTLLMDGPWPGSLRTVEYIKPDGKTYEQRRVHINKFYINIPAVDLDPSDNPESMTYFMVNNPKKYREWKEYEEWNEKTYGENSDYNYILGVFWPLFKRYEYPKLTPNNKKYYDYLEKMIQGMRKIGDSKRKRYDDNLELKYDVTELRAFWEPITDYIKKDNEADYGYHGADFARFYYDEEYKQAKQANLFGVDNKTRLEMQPVVKEEEEEYFGFTIKTTTKGDDKRIEVFSPPKMPETEQTFDTVEDAKKWIDGVIQEVEQQAKDKAEQERLEKLKQERMEAMRKFPSDTVDDNLWYWKLEDNKLYYSSETYEGQWQTWSYLTPDAVKGYLRGEDVLLYDEDESTGTAFEASLFQKSVYPNLVEYLKKELDLKPKEQEPKPEQKKPEEKPEEKPETETEKGVVLPKVEWVSKVQSNAESAASQLGIDPAFIISHWALETGYRIPVNNNLAGLTRAGVRAGFRDYPSIEDFTTDWVKQIERNWPDVKKARTIQQYADALQNKGRIGPYAEEEPGLTYAQRLAGVRTGYVSKFTYDDDQDTVDQKDKTANDVDDIIKDKETEVEIPDQFGKQKGLIDPPIVGNITSGSTDNPNRLFFKPQQGSQVAAFSDGEVNMVITTPGKSIIVIEHDDGYRTAYFNITDIKVRKYDTVKRGDVIAMVGKGQVGFEIQRDRRAIDPTGWFKE
jgi:murein DD-endopeptidase MepM/ murein hydrolase activator NlpD